jgi:hypothetical protein
MPADEQRRRSSHKSETRISAIADLAEKGKREKKALLLSLWGAVSGEAQQTLQPEHPGLAILRPERQPVAGRVPGER